MDVRTWTFIIVLRVVQLPLPKIYQVRPILSNSRQLRLCQEDIQYTSNPTPTKGQYNGEHEFIELKQ